MKLTEAQLEKYVTDLLEHENWRSLKTDPVSRREWGKGFGEKGMADRLYIRYANDNPYRRVAGGYRGDQPDYRPRGWAEVLWIELKRPGAKAKPHQTEWKRNEQALGALVVTAGEEFEATPEGFLDWYRKSGLMRRKIL